MRIFQDKQTFRNYQKYIKKTDEVALSRNCSLYIIYKETMWNHDYMRLLDTNFLC